MTDEPGREPEPTGSEPETRLPATRPEPTLPTADRFSSPPSARSFELTPERSARIVRASADARFVAFLAVVIVGLFVMIYYFYELGLPGGIGPQSRLSAEEEHQQVLAVERGYNIYQANCANCHGVDGEGGVGPVLNSQEKLFQHLNPSYLNTILTVGGRFACGNPNSVMPVWSNEGTPPGPLNYKQIEDLIAFLRAPSDHTFTVRDPELFEPETDPATGQVKTFTGWVDPEYRPAPGATPFPDCWSDALAGASPSPGASAAPSLPADATVLEVVAQNVAFDVTELTAPAGEAFGIELDQRDTGVGGHDVDIRTEDGTTVVDNPTVMDPAVVTYPIEALEAGTYTFICSVHPIPAMTGTLTVE
jgi:mono/diheme cytochrome c family protein/plastocyanin